MKNDQQKGLENTFTVSSVEQASATSQSFPVIYEAEYFPHAVPYSPNTQQITYNDKTAMPSIKDNSEKHLYN